MKPRIQIDSSLVAVAIILTVFLFRAPQWYPIDIIHDDVWDVLGILCILKGVLFRMIARAHKVANSHQSEKLVTTGIYSLIRNPMYFGSFLIGAGFVLLLWPWPTVFIFALAFYFRFIKQIRIEEKFLTENFGAEYESYCNRVPRFFPRMESVFMIKPPEILNLEEAFKTKEVRNLYTWLPLAVILEVIQEWSIYADGDLLKAVIIFILTAAAFFAVTMLFYKGKYAPDSE